MTRIDNAANADVRAMPAGALIASATSAHDATSVSAPT